MRKDNILIALVAAAAFALAVLIFMAGGMSVLIAAAAIVLAISLLKNEYLLMLLLFFIPLFPKINLVSIPGTITAIRVEDFFLALVIFFVILKSLNKKEGIKFDRFTAALALFVGISFVSLLMGLFQGTIEANSMSLLYFVRRIEYVMLFFVGFSIADSVSIGTVKKAFVPVFLIVAAFGLLQAAQITGGFFLGQYIEGAGGRIFSTFGVPGELAAFIAIIFTLSVMGMQDSKGLTRFFWTLLGALQIFILFLSLSRIELLSIPLGLVAYGILKGKGRQILVLTVLLVILAGALAPSEVKDRFTLLFSGKTIETISDIVSGAKDVDIKKARQTETYQNLGYDLSTVERLYQWISAYNAFTVYPVFGAGQSAFGEFVDNNYLRLLGENGIVGLAVFLFIIYHIWKSCLKVYNDSRMPKDVRDYAVFMIVMLVNMLVIALMVDAFEMSKIAFLFWLLTGVFFKIKAIREKEAAALTS